MSLAGVAVTRPISLGETAASEALYQLLLFPKRALTMKSER